VSDGVTCGLERDSGVAYCWGPNDYGQVGDGTTARRLEPTRVAGGLRFSSIDAGDGMVCAVEAASGEGYCWGHNLDGSLGDGTTASRSTPTLVGGGRLRFLRISAGGAGGGYEACGIAAPTGRAFCWGHGALVPTPIWQATPAAVTSASARLTVHR
jgi:serine/threonine-protein kinase